MLLGKDFVMQGGVETILVKLKKLIMLLDIGNPLLQVQKQNYLTLPIKKKIYY